MQVVAVLALMLVSSSSIEAASFMYWIDGDTDKIQRANLDGTGVTDLVTGLSAPVGLSLDVAGGHMYWTDSGTDKIQRANLDGSDVTNLVTTGLSAPYGLALTTEVPEPSTLLLLGTGLVGLVGYGRRKRRA